MRQIFHSLPWIPPKEPPELQKLYRDYGVPVSFKSQELLKHNGDPSKLFYITKGAAAYYIADHQLSHSNVLELIIPDRTACDLSAITRTKVNVATRALGPCEALMIPPQIIREEMMKDAKFATLVAEHGILKQECGLEAMVANFTLEPAVRLKTLLKVILISYEQSISDGWNKLPINLNNEQFGSIVNLTRVSVSRIFSQWIAEGLMQKTKKSIEVKEKLFNDVYDWLDSSSPPSPWKRG